LLCELNQLFSEYYSLRGDHENSISLTKSGVANCIKTLGSHSIKTAEKYYELGDVEEVAGRREEALGSFRKARAIFESEQKTNSISYAMINFKVARLDLYFGRMQDAEESLMRSLQLFSKNHESCES
jgi:tetratricopeptide (TPR) repeat protein